MNVFVTLSFLIACVPLQAMEEKFEENDILHRAPSNKALPYAQWEIPTKLERVLRPLGEYVVPLPCTVVIQKNYDPNSAITMLHPELVQMILESLDIRSIIIARQVCKLWKAKSTNRQEQDIEQSVQLLADWKHGDESEQLLKAFTFNPHHLLLALQVLAPLMPLCTPIEEAYTINWSLHQNALNTEGDRPEIIEKLVSVLKVSRINKALIIIFLNHIDVLDLSLTSLAVCILKQIPEVCDILENIEEALRLEPEQFLEIVKDINNHPRLQKYLMTLKLLALSENAEAIDRLSKLSTPIGLLLKGSSEKIFEENSEISEESEYLTNHPLWGAYGLGGELLSNQWDAIFMHNSYGKDFDPDRLKAFWKYYSTIESRYRLYDQKFLFFIRLFDIYLDRKDNEGLVNTLSALTNAELKELVSPSESSFLSPIEKYTSRRDYFLALSILKEAKKRYRDTSFQAKVGFLKKCITATQNEKCFPEADEYLKEVLGPFQLSDSSDSSDSDDYISSDESGSSVKSETSEIACSFEEELDENSNQSSETNVSFQSPFSKAH